jgi:outer membrane protein insertion porin family
MATSKVTQILLAILLCLLVMGVAMTAEPEPGPAPPPATAEAESGEQPAPPPAVESGPEAGPAPAEPPAEAATATDEGATEEAPATEETPAAEEPPAEPTGPAVVAVEVKGNEQIATETILEACPLKVGDVYTAETGEAAAQAIRDLGWFFSVTVTAPEEGDGVRLVINTVENQVINDIAFEGNTIYSDETLRELMETKPGAVWNHNTLRSDLDAVVDKYDKAGYIFARVLSPDIQLPSGTLVIPIVEGVIEAIRIEGNRKTRTYVITRGLRMRAGQPYRKQTADRDLEILMNLDLFESLSMEWQVGTEIGAIIVVITVREKKTGLASVGVGWSSVQNLVGFVDATESNLKGTGQLVNVRAEFGGRTSYELGYYNPWIDPHRTSIRVGLYNKLILREAYTEDDSFLYDEKRSGGNVTLSRPLAEDTRGYLSLRIDDVSAQESDSSDSGTDVALLQSSKVRSIGLTLVNDTRDYVANPTRGAMNSLSAEQAGLIGGGSRFGKFGADFRRYYRMGSADRIVAARLLLGITTGSPPFLEQFLVGGGETLRGYRNDRFPGRNMAILNLEYRFPISKKSRLIGVAFTDVGDAWGGSFAELYGDENFKAHFGYGAGIRVVTPIGPLRLDYGIGSEGAETHFSVGHVF